MSRVALVTGSTSGIGLGIARKLASQGCHVVLNGFGDKKYINEISQDIRRSFSVEVLYSDSDLSNPDDIELMMHMIINSLGPIDILVNNAGIQHVSPIETFPPEKWDAILAVNLSSVFHIIRHALPSMKKKGWGRIINIASAHAVVASPFKSAYVAAKHGVAGLTKTVALEVASQNITCNAICPGYVKTPLVENQIQDTAKARGISPDSVIADVILGSQPTKKFVTIEDIAEMVWFLCLDSAQSITGSLFPIDGGWTAQ